MIKYYFVSWLGDTGNGCTKIGYSLAKVTNASLKDWCKSLASENDCLNPVTILSVKDLSEEEYLMLSGKDLSEDNQKEENRS